MEFKEKTATSPIFLINFSSGKPPMLRHIAVKPGWLRLAGNYRRYVCPDISFPGHPLRGAI
jgi:hypothetical protein